MSANAYSRLTDDIDFTPDELDAFREALTQAASEGNRFDGKEGARAWEDSLRDAC